MPKNPNNFKPFSFLDLDPEAVADQLARMPKDDAGTLLQRASVWFRDVGEWEQARRWRREGDHERV